jgi:PPOX class probable F420-dependent enzyme
VTAPAPGVVEFVRGPHVAVLATLRPDGRPHATPVWYEYNGSEFVVGTFRNTQKAQNVARKGFATLCIFTHEVPYKQVIVEGTARLGSSVDNVWRERLATRYLGETAGHAYVRDTEDFDVVAINVKPVRWITEGFGAEQEERDDD